MAKSPDYMKRYRAGGGGNVTSSVTNSMKQSTIISDAINFGASNPFKSSYWVQHLKNEIARAIDRKGKEPTIKQIDEIADSLNAYVTKRRKKN